MTPDEAARRLSVHETQISAVGETPAGHVVDLADGSRWLVTTEVARRFVPEVDGERTTEVAEEQSGERTTEPAPKPRAQRKKTASGG